MHETLAAMPYSRLLPLAVTGLSLGLACQPASSPVRTAAIRCGTGTVGARDTAVLDVVLDSAAAHSANSLALETHRGKPSVQIRVDSALVACTSPGSQIALTIGGRWTSPPFLVLGAPAAVRIRVTSDGRQFLDTAVSTVGHVYHDVGWDTK